MTDQEIICTWMEPKPTSSADAATGHKWWVWLSGPNAVLFVCDPTLMLGLLWEVEERLIELGYRDHIDNAISFEVWRDAVSASTWHATPEQKVKAIAVVLRPLVEHAG